MIYTYKNIVSFGAFNKLILSHLNIIYFHGYIVTLPCWQPVAQSIPDVLGDGRCVVFPWFRCVIGPVVRKESVRSSNSNVENQIKLKKTT